MRFDEQQVGARRAEVAGRLPWVRVCADAPYFEDEHGCAFTPIGANEAITWPNLAPAFRRRDLAAVEAHVADLVAQGVTVMRLMLEYAQGRGRFLERPAGVFAPNMVRLWDDLIAICERTGVRVLLTPFDTFWTWIGWRDHPYNTRNGGPLPHPSRMLLCPDARAAIKQRLTFAVKRWGGSGAIFAWDLWNEIHPAQAEDCADVFPDFIADLARHVRALEYELYGRSHPLTVSLFGPELVWRPHMPLAAPIFRHPDLDFATIHIYAEGGIDDPRDTVAGAVAMGRIVRNSLVDITDGRPFLDTEHGPIHAFKDKGRTLPAAFDEEYFRHMQWAHLASGGVGGGMRWPNRDPHVLTPGMRAEQGKLARFAASVAWRRFRRRCWNDDVATVGADCAAFACGDADQAIAYLLRRDACGPDGTIDRTVPPIAPSLRLPSMPPGRYRAIFTCPVAGEVIAEHALVHRGGSLDVACPPFVSDLAIRIAGDG